MKLSLLSILCISTALALTPNNGQDEERVLMKKSMRRNKPKKGRRGGNKHHCLDSWFAKGSFFNDDSVMYSFRDELYYDEKSLMEGGKVIGYSNGYCAFMPQGVDPICAVTFSFLSGDELAIQGLLVTGAKGCFKNHGHVKSNVIQQNPFIGEWKLIQ